MKKILQLLLVLTITAGNSFADITVDTAADNSSVGALENNGTCSLREAINNANKASNDPLRSLDCTAGSATPENADTIVFSGVSTVNLVDDIFVISDVTIKGPITISGGNTTSMFTVASGVNGKLRIINNTKLENGKDASGGAIRLNNLENLFQCKNSSFKNNVADNNGGAILSSGSLDIDTCKFENNRAGRDGGAIWKGGGDSGIVTMSINASDFIDNKSGTDTQIGGEGGAIFFAGGTTLGSIAASRFDGNTAQSGTSSSDGNGGGAINNAGVLTITASAFAGNKVNAFDMNSSQAWHGGAIFNESGGILAVNYSHFGETPLPLPAPFNTLTDANEVTTDAGVGGAIFSFGDLFVLSSSFIGNMSAYDGGAIGVATNTDSLFSQIVQLVSFAGTTVSNSMFSGNMATRRGGAMHNLRNGSLIKIINTTIANNSAAEGGGLYNTGDGDDFDTVNDEFYLENTIIANNSAVVGANCSGGTTASEGTNNLVFPASAGCPNASAVNGNPNLSGTPEITFSIPLILNYSLPLGAGSAALGAGDPTVCANFPIINLDQRAFPRPQGDTNCDIGSYESPAIGMPTNTPTSTPSNTATNTSTPTQTATQTNTATNTVTPTQTNTATNTTTPTQTSTFTNTTTPTQTYTPTNTKTATVTNTPTNTITGTRTNTPTSTQSSTPTQTATSTQSSTPTNTSTSTQSSTPTNTSTSTQTYTATNTATNTATGTLTITPTISVTFTASATASVTNTPDFTATETPIVSATPTLDVTVTVPQGVTPGTGNDPGCSGTEIKNQQFLLDGQAAQQKRLIARARALAKKAGVTGSKAVKLDKIVDSSSTAYIRMWSGIWSYENVIIQCSNTVLCNSVDITTTAKAFQKDSDLMGSLLNDAIKVLRSVTGNKKSGAHLVKQMKNLQGLNFAALGMLPKTKSVCN